MLQNAYFVAKIGADTAENEQHSAEILPTDAPRRAVGGVRPERRQVREGAPLSPGRRRLRALGRGRTSRPVPRFSERLPR